MSFKAEIIQVPNTLRAKVGGKLANLDQALIDKAEAALADLSSQFSDWLMDEIKKLEERQERIRVEGYTLENTESLYFCCHDLKGLGTTYGFPLITRLAGSLCKMMDEPGLRMQAPRKLVDAHLDAIKAAVRDNIKDTDHPIGKVLAETLEARVKEHMASFGVEDK
jgi:hypothetical protein